jgi:hypothetical protein
METRREGEESQIAQVATMARQQKHIIKLHGICNQSFHSANGFSKIFSMSA